MTFLSIVFAMILEQFRAPPAARVALWLSAYASFLQRQFDGGEGRHGAVAWGIGVALPAALLLVLRWMLEGSFSLFVFLLFVAVLYLTVGFRQFSHYFTDIQLALRMGEVERARSLLSEWRGGLSVAHLSSEEVARLTIEQGMVASYRHVFAPLLWFVACGPAGVVLYRLALALVEHAASAGNLADRGDFAAFSRRALDWLDRVPLRITAITFAVVGNFEDAIFCWRTQASQWGDAASGILLTSAAGALGIKLGLPVTRELGVEPRPEAGVGEDAAVEHLQSAIGLVWRALVLCLLLLALLTLASWVGG